jgi:hypothetical protein
MAIPVDVAQVQTDVEDYLTAAGLPTSVVQTVLAAIDDAGYSLVDKDGVTPLLTALAVPGERVRVDGMPGTWLVGINCGASGWVAWVEHVRPDGGRDRSSTFLLPAGANLTPNGA